VEDFKFTFLIKLFCQSKPSVIKKQSKDFQNQHCFILQQTIKIVIKTGEDNPTNIKHKRTGTESEKPSILPRLDFKTVMANMLYLSVSS
jgi:hypothetical protein